MIARRDPSPSRSGAAGSGGLRHRHPGPAAPAQWLDATRPLPGRSQRHDPAAAHLPLLRRESLTHGARQARRPRPSISPYYERVHRLALVVTDPAAVTDTVARVARELGPVDVLVNNAGVAESAPFAKTDAALWRRHFDVNVNGPYLLTRAVLPGMLERRWGRIINIA